MLGAGLLYLEMRRKKASKAGEGYYGLNNDILEEEEETKAVEKEIGRVGGQGTAPVDVRVIAATHRNLEEMVKQGKVREDLYYRLNVMKIDIPSLMERKQDIPAIAAVLLRKLEKNFDRPVNTLSKEAENHLLLHTWPGNVRELENVLERAVNVMDGSVIRLDHLPLYLQEEPSQEAGIRSVKTPVAVMPVKYILQKAEKEAIQHALCQSANKTKAARLLGIGKTKLYDKCREYGL